MAKELFEGVDPPMIEQINDASEQPERTFTEKELGLSFGVGGRTITTRWLPNILDAHPWFSQDDLAISCNERITGYREIAFDLLAEYQELRATKVPAVIDGEIPRTPDGKVANMVANNNRISPAEYKTEMLKKQPREQKSEQAEFVEVAGIAAPIVLREHQQSKTEHSLGLVFDDLGSRATELAEENQLALMAELEQAQQEGLVIGKLKRIVRRNAIAEAEQEAVRPTGVKDALLELVEAM